MAVPGDIVDVQVTHKRRSYMEGNILKLVTPSPMRLEPFCSHFGDCGGCRWQPYPTISSWNSNNNKVIDQLTRIGRLTLPPVHPILGSEKTVQYRNKLEFHLLQQPVGASYCFLPAPTPTPTTTATATATVTATTSIYGSGTCIHNGTGS